MRDPYQVLGIDRNATPEEVKKAYRAASRKYHPDSNPDNPKFAEEMFKEVQQAYRDIIEGRAEQSYGSAAGGYAGRTGSGAGYAGRTNTGTGYAGRTSAGNTGYGSQRGTGYSGAGTGSKTTYAGNGQRMDSGTRTKKTYGQPGKPVCDEHDSRELKDAAACINAGCYKEALNILDTIQLRGDKWYYFSAIANNGAKNIMLARQQIESAIFLNPNNLDYVIFKQRIESGMNWYQKQSNTYDKPYVGSNSEWGLGNILLRLLCMFCC